MIYILLIIILWFYIIGGRILWKTRDMFVPTSLSKNILFKIGFWLVWWVAATLDILGLLKDKEN